MITAEPAPAPADHGRLPDALWLGVLLLLALVVALIWMPFSLYRVDTLTFYLPWYIELGEHLRSLDIPGWLPSSMSGAPLAGDPQSGWGYLPAMAIFAAFPSLFGFKIFLLFHILFAATSSYLYARVIGLRPIGAFATGAAFTFGNFLERTSCCTIHMQVAIWIPFVYLCVDLSQRAATKTARVGWLLVAGVATSQVVAGWVGQGAYYGGLAIGVYLLYRYLLAPRRYMIWRQRVAGLALSALVMGIIAASLSATAVLPRLDVVSRTNLANLYDDGTGTPERTGWAFSLFVWRLVGRMAREGRWYFGMAALAVVLIAPWLVGWRRDMRFHVLFFVVSLSLIVAGSPSLAAANLLPRFESLHAHSPDRIYIVLFLAPAILAGYLIDALSDRSWSPPTGWRLLIGLELPVVLIVAALIYVQYQRDDWIPASRVVFTVLACAAVGLAVIRSRRRVAWIGIAALLTLLFVDPTGRLLYLRMTDESRVELAHDLIDQHRSRSGAAVWLLERAAEGEPFRYFGYDLAVLTNDGDRETYISGHYEPSSAPLLLNNRGVWLGLEDIQGYNPVQISRYVTYFRTMNGQSQSYHTASVLEGGLDSPLLDLLNTRYIVMPAAIPPNRPDLFHLAQRYPTVYRDDTTRIVENRNALPRAWIVHEAVRTKTGQILPQFADGSVDPRVTALLDTNAPALAPAEDASAETVQIITRDSDQIRLSVNVTSRSLVVLSEIWDSDWTATVDGQDARVYRSNYMFRGVLVEPGTHEIVLRYPVTTIRQTAWLYLIPTAAFALLGLARATTRMRPGFARGRAKTAPA
jgi:hypothetical protein